jgi:NurA-like 5'-3' nuclease
MTVRVQTDALLRLRHQHRDFHKSIYLVPLRRSASRLILLSGTLYGELFGRKVLPNAHTFSSLLKACVGLQSLSMALQLHAVIIKLLDEEGRDCFVWNALIDAHAKLGALSNPEVVFHGMK